MKKWYVVINNYNLLVYLTSCSGLLAREITGPDQAMPCDNVQYTAARASHTSEIQRERERAHIRR